MKKIMFAIISVAMLSIFSSCTDSPNPEKPSTPVSQEETQIENEFFDKLPSIVGISSDEAFGIMEIDRESDVEIEEPRNTEENKESSDTTMYWSKKPRIIYGKEFHIVYGISKDLDNVSEVSLLTTCEGLEGFKGTIANLSDVFTKKYGEGEINIDVDNLPINSKIDKESEDVDVDNLQNHAVWTVIEGDGVKYSVKLLMEVHRIDEKSNIVHLSFVER